MKLIAFIASASALLLANGVVAVPVSNTNQSSSNTSSASAAAANAGTPQCKSAMMSDLCLADNAGAYCDVTGFHNDFMKSCEGNCFCA
ncbi:hypothetical protein B0J18DRAFT_32853 [Chaetomium sp. MPI-SDFR-AT-0129]|uniref:Uncharacterized protein n=1 Tax=Dichotomopilus funicola TaxID=1934379 RepID=A0AAN6V5T9_9PEZI|nr:hypothetical protein B0J18DRAFT_32853 [Chaetomium sp. MPI-SDFR-AT-0129]KAK4144585.1 hypothetical protein C8A04DRAFT_27772 [Dichotomopilus funicola]